MRQNLMRFSKSTTAHWLACIAVMMSVTPLLSWGASQPDFDVPAMEVACAKAVEGYRHAVPVVEESRIIAWYRIKDQRPWYVDAMLCWGHAWIDGKHVWTLAHLVQNSEFRWLPPIRFHPPRWWHRFDDFLRLDRPPTANDVEKSTFRFKVDNTWELYSTFIDGPLWTTLFDTPIPVIQPWDPREIPTSPMYTSP